MDIHSGGRGPFQERPTRRGDPHRYGGEIEKEVGSAVGEISAIRPPLKVELVRDPTQVLLISHGVGGLGDKGTEGREPEMVSHFPKH